jgi:hypothetical protein
MDIITITHADGSTQEFYPQPYTDDAVAKAVAAVTPAPVVAPEATEIDIVLTDGSIKKFVPAA